MTPQIWRTALFFLLATTASGNWNASWIWVDGSDPFGYGVYHFRKSFDLPAKPSTFRIHATADNRYQLFVNGERVVWGPARGDLYHWRYETVDIAPHLRPGRNVLAAVVWNDGEHRAVAQISHRTAFLVQGETAKEEVVNTGTDWRGIQNSAYQPIPITFGQVRGYVAIPPGEEVDGSRYPWGWEHLDYDDSAWKPVGVGRRGSPRDTLDAPARWMLVPRSIPLMEERPERLSRVRTAEGIDPPGGFPREKTGFRIPARTRVQLLLDHDRLTTGYPELTVTGGRGATISLRYAEALWKAGERVKGHRDEVEGKEFFGFRDVFRPDGGDNRFWRPLFWRTWRYIEFTVETAGEPLTIEDFAGVYTGYPFERKARFDAGSEELDRMLDVGWRTARLCAHESYMDCPYYEQLQYVGDTRIQALVSVYMSGDTRLMRNAIEQLGSSQTSEGATYSRAPSALQQYIPPFSLWWIGMVHDYWWYVDDAEFVRQMLPRARSVLAFFGSYQKEDASLRTMPWWNYVDWVERWPRGMAPMAKGGSTAAIELQLLLAYQWAAQLEDALGWKELAGIYRTKAEELKATIFRRYWAGRRGLLADTPAHKDFSQQANSLAVLAGIVRGEDAQRLMERTLADSSLAPASIYFRYYLHRALAKAGMGDRYLDMLGPWRKMLSDGLTTWAERDTFRVRSDCHAWGSSPNIELFRTVLGIDSAAPGFGKVSLQPHLGRLRQVSGAIPHPKGEIAVSLRKDGDTLNAEISLPPGLEGDIQWRGESQPLGSGKTTVRLP